MTRPRHSVTGTVTPAGRYRSTARLPLTVTEKH